MTNLSYSYEHKLFVNKLNKLAGALCGILTGFFAGFLPGYYLFLSKIKPFGNQRRAFALYIITYLLTLPSFILWQMISGSIEGSKKGIVGGIKYIKTLNCLFQEKNNLHLN